jgi:hypothetical protein
MIIEWDTPGFFLLAIYALIVIGMIIHATKER